MTDNPANTYVNATSCIAGNDDTVIKSDCIPLKIFKFSPSYYDTSCSLTVNYSASCSNFFIDNHSSPDPYFYDSPQTCSTVNSTIGQKQQQSEVRIMNNNYTFTKRCIKLNKPIIVNIGGSGATSFYKMSCKSPMELFIMLRPCMILFPQCGLFYFKPFSQQTMPVSATVPAQPTMTSIDYSNKDATAIVDLYMSPVSNTKIFPALPSPDQLANLSNKVLYPTIYYFNYLEPTDYYTTDIDLNTLTLICDTKPFSKSFPLPTSTAPYSTCTNLKIDWTPLAGTFVVSIESSQGNSFTMTIHPDFTNAIANADNGAIKMFNVVFTYTVDMIIITGLYKDLSSSTSKPLMTMVKRQVSNGTGPIYLKYPQSTNNKDFTGNASICPQSVVPNLALVTKELGYTFTI